MTKRNELVATAHLKKKDQGREMPAVPVQKDRNEAYREKEKSDRDKGTNTSGERGLSSQEKGNTRRRKEEEEEDWWRWQI